MNPCWHVVVVFSFVMLLLLISYDSFDNCFMGSYSDIIILGGSLCWTTFFLGVSSGVSLKNLQIQNQPFQCLGYKMGSFRISCTKTHISKALALALHEWLLILMLFVNAIFSYLITKFADYCQLQTPCLLCSRLDHIFSSGRLQTCWDLICSNHKSEISSLVYCQFHGKLVDNVHGLCESCLCSNATIKESNAADTYRLLVQKLHADSGSSNLSDDIHDFVTSSTRQCICCNQTCAPGISLEMLLKLSSSGHQRSDKSSVAVRDPPEKIIGADGLVDHPLLKGYNELKIHSDTETEAAHTEDCDDTKGFICDYESLAEDHNMQLINSEPQSITLSNDFAMKKSIDQVSASEPSALISDAKRNDYKSASSVPIVHVQEEVDGQNIILKTESSSDSVAHSPMPSEAGDQASIAVLKETQLVSLDDVPLISEGQKCQDNFQKGIELISLDKFPVASNALEVPVEFLKENEIIPISSAVEVPQKSCEARTIETTNVENKELGLYNCEEHLTDATPKINLSPSGSILPLTEIETETERGTIGSSSQQYLTQISPKANPSQFDSGMQVHDLSLQVGDALDLSGAYKIAVANRGRQYRVEVEQWAGRVSSRISEEVKALVSQISASTPRIELSPKGMSPKISISSDDLRSFDGLQVLLQKRFSLERNESNISLDGITVFEIEGENEIDRLKRQVEQDKKIVTSLLKELDEEKNSSAVAVNQAMSMITRLQEEKAVLQIEALQNLRVAEEEAGYAMEALQKMNDLLFEKEKLILDLDAQLEFYQLKLSGPSTVGNNITGSKNDVLDDIKEKVDEPDPPCHAMSNLMKNSLLGFEEEISYISGCLEKMKKRLQSHPGAVCANRGEVSDQKDTNLIDSQENGELEEIRSQLQGDVGLGRKPDMGSLEDEVSEVQERLETLKGAFSFFSTQPTL